MHKSEKERKFFKVRNLFKKSMCLHIYTIFFYIFTEVFLW